MEKTNTYSLLSALGGEEKKEVYSASGQRKRQNEKWIALQSSPQEEQRPRLDPLPQEPRMKLPQTTYVRQLNDKIDRLIAINKAKTHS